MNLKNLNKKGFSLVEVMATVAVLGLFLSALLNLLASTSISTRRMHNSLFPLLEAKNFWYKTERSRKENEDKNLEHIQEGTLTNIKLSLKIKKNNEATNIFEKYENLEIIELVAINSGGKVPREDSLLLFKSTPPEEKDAKSVKEDQVKASA